MTRDPARSAEERAVSPVPIDPADGRARIRRFGLMLAAGVVLLALAAVGYVLLFGHVLADANRPPTAGSLNPRVLAVELLVLLAGAVGVTTIIVRRRRRS